MIDIPSATAPENNVVVHAAAGTGKTWLLTSRIVRLLLAGAEPGAILAITFTRKAAGEIRERVTERLLALAGADEEALVAQLTELGASTDRATLEAARGLYEKHLNAIHALRATTFHAFCQEILRRFPLEADVPPGFDLLEATTELEDAAWLALDRNILREKDGALARAMDTLLKECGGVPGARKALADFIAHRSDWWAYTETQSDPAAFAAARLATLLHITDGPDPLDAFAHDPDMRRRLARYGELLAKHPTESNREHAENLSRALAEQTPSKRTLTLIGGVFLKKDGEPRQMKRTKTLVEKIGAAEADEIVALHQEITARLLEARAEHKRRRTYEVSRTWYMCGEALLREFQRFKAERGLLDFADLEWKTYRLLSRSRHAEWVQYKLDQRIDHLLVDEFQDTNPTQWRLLLPLLEEMAAGDPERRRSVFIVGDEKQSIYRFRRAEARLFHAARHWLTEHAQARTFTQHVSQRSARAIIRFVNLIFHRGGEETAETAEDFVLQDFHPHDTRHKQLWGLAEVLPLIRRKNPEKREEDTAWRNPLEQPRLTDEDARHRDEGDLIAAKIRELLGKPITEGGQVRPLHGGDIMILLRDRTHARFYEEALRRAGIPYIGTGRGAFLQSLEVRDLRHLLRALIEPYNDLALASALRSPVFAATEDELILLARNEPGPWRERLLRLSAESLPPDGALARARQWLPRWSGYVDRVPVHDLLDRIYNEGNLIARYMAAAPAHLRPRVETNLNRFLELALEVDSGRYPSLSHFLTHIENRAEDDTEAPAEPAWNRTPRVRVMTIHAAKGLEAPAVFLADSARDPGNRERGARALIEWPVSDPRPRHFHLTGNKEERDDISEALLEEQRPAARREEANLLYVALTRAKQVLYVSGCEPGRGERGWYGFIEKRLRRVEHTGEAAAAGAEIRHLHADDGALFNTCARLEFGTPAMPAAETSPVAPATFELDPALTRPLALAPEAGLLYPSQTVAAEDDTPPDVSPPSGARAAVPRRGVAIHRMLEQLTGTEDRSAVEQRLRREFGETASEEEFSAWWREACAVIDHAPFRDFFEPTRYREARNEIPILYRDGGRDIYGVIDRLILREKEIVLIDYKTHARAAPENLVPLAQAFAPQIRQYGEGARRLWPQKKLRLLLLFTACRGVVEIPP